MAEHEVRASSATPGGAPQATTAAPEFGLTGAQTREAAAGAVRKADVDSIDSVITAVSKRRTGELIVTLENGQVWLQLETDSSVLIKPGDAVKIRKAALGSYKLVSGRSTTRVRRVR